MKPTLVFDYDGTIHNIFGIYEPSFRETYRWLVEENLVEEEEIPTELIYSWLGINAADMWNSFQPDLDDRYKKMASARIGNSLASMVEEGKAVWYEGAAEVLTELKNAGYTMVVLSNCDIKYRDSHFKAFDMGRWFDRFYDCESYGFIPKAEIIPEIRKVYPGELIVIGDRKSDRDCAVSAKCTFIACDYGFAAEGELDAAKYHISSIRELPDLLKKVE